jgi:hypothetical protein
VAELPRRRAGDAAGKLRAVARRWAGAGDGGSGWSAAGNASLKAALEAAGLAPDAVAAELAKRPVQAVDAVELDADDEGRAAAVFYAMDTQWNWVPGGMVNGTGGFPMMTGLRYEAIAAAAAPLGITVDGRVMADLRTLEAEALRVMAEKRR